MSRRCWVSWWKPSLCWRIVWRQQCWGCRTWSYSRTMPKIHWWSYPGNLSTTKRILRVEYSSKRFEHMKKLIIINPNYNCLFNQYKFLFFRKKSYCYSKNILLVCIMNWKKNFLINHLYKRTASLAKSKWIRRRKQRTKEIGEFEDIINQSFKLP